MGQACKGLALYEGLSHTVQKELLRRRGTRESCSRKALAFGRQQTLIHQNHDFLIRRDDGAGLHEVPTINFSANPARFADQHDTSGNVPQLQIMFPEALFTMLNSRC